MSPSDHHACEARYRQLLDRLHDMTERLEQVEQDHRTLIDLLHDFRELLRLLTARLRRLDQRVEQRLARLLPLREAGERIARHFRN